MPDRGGFCDVKSGVAGCLLLVGPQAAPSLHNRSGCSKVVAAGTLRSFLWSRCDQRKVKVAYGMLAVSFPAAKLRAASRCRATAAGSELIASAGAFAESSPASAAAGRCDRRDSARPNGDESVRPPADRSTGRWENPPHGHRAAGYPLIALPDSAPNGCASPARPL